MPVDVIRNAIRDVPDFPSPGIVFKDISPILESPKLFKDTIDEMCKPYEQAPPDIIVAIDARGFIFGAAMAYKMSCGLCMMRKKGKLPWKTIEISYDLEYGSNEMELHEDAVTSGNRVLIVDDVLATGGTAEAAVKLINDLDAEVIALSVFMEIPFLEGRAKISCPIHALIS